MPRGKTEPVYRQNLNPAAAPSTTIDAAIMSGRSYFSANAEVDDIREWDIKGEWTIQALLAIIASGDTVMISKTKSGDAVSLAISSAPKVWQRVYIRDADAWDEAMVRIVRAAAPLQVFEAAD